MAWSYDDYQQLLASTVKVCMDHNRMLVETWRFKADVYNPPIEMGFPAQLYTLVPALHVYSATGQKTHTHMPENFRVSINLN